MGSCKGQITTKSLFQLVTLDRGLSRMADGDALLLS